MEHWQQQQHQHSGQLPPQTHHHQPSPQQHQPYSDAAGNPSSRHGQQLPRDYAPQHHPASAPSSAGAQPPAAAHPQYRYDQYHGGAPVAAAAHPPSSSASASAAASPLSAGLPQLRDGNGDLPMHDAHDPHAGIKYPMRPHHQSHLSGGRVPTLQNNMPQQEPSSAAQRYSPMEALSPASPYGSKPAQYGAPTSQRQSPTKPGDYPSSPYFAGRSQGQQLPPISPYTSAPDGYASSAVANFDGQFNDPKSPRRQMAPSMPAQKGPVPEFKKVRAVSDLRPKNSQQPPFRRANPEGGFISVCTCPLLTT